MAAETPPLLEPPVLLLARPAVAAAVEGEVARRPGRPRAESGPPRATDPPGWKAVGAEPPPQEPVPPPPPLPEEVAAVGAAG